MTWKLPRGEASFDGSRRTRSRAAQRCPVLRASKGQRLQDSVAGQRERVGAATRAALVSQAASSHAPSRIASRGASLAASRPHTRAASRPITGKNNESVESGEEKVSELQQSPVASNLSLKDQVKEQQPQKQKEHGERLRVRLEDPSPGPFRNAVLTLDSSRFYHD